ncbi:hypothetical protein FEP90_00585 [Burkholderia multivorans]|nr:hypothetical protein [Burkholderia multivorans]
MRNIRRSNLDDERKTHGARGLRGFVRRRCDGLARHPYPVCRQHTFGILLTEHVAARLCGGEDRPRRCGRVRCGSPQPLVVTQCTAFMPVAPGANRGEATVCRTEKHHVRVRVEHGTARSLQPLVHPDGSDRALSAGSHFTDDGGSRTRCRLMRKYKRHDYRAETRIIDKSIQAMGESRRGFKDLCRQIRRICDGTEVGYHGGECFVRRRGKFRKLKAMLLSLVGIDHARATRGRHDADAASFFWRIVAREEIRHFQHRFEIIGLDRADFLERCTVRGDGADERAGMRECRLAARCRVARLVDDQWLARSVGEARGLEEARSALDAFEQADDGADFRIVSESGDEIGHVHVGRVARGEVVADADTTGHRLQHRIAERTTLRNHRDPA